MRCLSGFRGRHGCFFPKPLGRIQVQFQHHDDPLRNLWARRSQPPFDARQEPAADTHETGCFSLRESLLLAGLSNRSTKVRWEVMPTGLLPEGFRCPEVSLPCKSTTGEHASLAGSKLFELGREFYPYTFVMGGQVCLGETHPPQDGQGAPGRSHLANSKLDECRRRVQNETMGHRGRKDDPLYRARRLLTKAHERLDERGNQRLVGLRRAGDPHGDVKTAWHAKEVVRSIYQIPDPDLATEYVTQLGADLQDDSCPPEVNSLGGTINRWRDQITAWHQARVTNGPTEAINNLIKRIKRIGFGFRKLRNYRIRALLYADRPNWDLLATITPR